jgi:hypothetical protein
MREKLRRFHLMNQPAVAAQPGELRFGSRMLLLSSDIRNDATV